MKHLKLLALLLFITFLAACGGGGEDETALAPASAHKNATATLVQPQSGWWWNPAESGSGYSIELQGNQIFMAAYLYETNGPTTWYTSGLTLQSSGAYSGAMQRYSGGQTLLGAYKAPASTTSVVANALLSFNTASTGTLTISFADGSPSRTVALQRFAFAAGAPSNGSFDNGWWWNEAESGRGYFIEAQGSVAFIGSYMFDSTGQPTWYVSAAALQGSQTLSGALDQYTSGQSLGGSFKAPTKAATSAGTMAFNFTSRTTANMILPNGKSVAMKRFIFSALPITNIAPSANAGFAQNVVVGSVVTLDGSASTDINADALTYKWTLTTKPAGSSAALSSSTTVNPTFTADLAGTYTVSLIVNDGKLSSAAATVAVVASEVPTADAGTHQEVTVGALVQLNGSGSLDASGKPITWNSVTNSFTATYAWTLTSKPTGSVAVLDYPGSSALTFTADVAGNYVASLVVTDGTITSTTSTVSVTSKTSASAPSVSLAASNLSPHQGDNITLTWSSPTGSSCKALGSWTGTLANAGSKSVLVRAFGANIYSIVCMTSSNEHNAANITINTSSSYASAATVPAGKHRLAKIDYRYDSGTAGNSNADVLTSFAGTKPMIDQIKAVGFSGVLLQLQTSINLDTGLVGFTDFPPNIKTPPADTWKVVDYAISQGLVVWIGLQITDSIQDQPITDTTKFGPGFDIKTMFYSATAFQTSIARQAESHGVYGIYISEFNNGIDTLPYASYWQSLVNSIRGVFSGKLAYMDGMRTDCVVYGMVDYVSIFFNPTLSKTATYNLASIVDLYSNNEFGQNYIAKLQSVYNTYGKRILLEAMPQVADTGVGIGIDVYNTVFNAAYSGTSLVGSMTPDFRMHSLRLSSVLEIVATKVSQFVDGVAFSEYTPWIQDPGNFDPSNPFYCLMFYSSGLYNNPQALGTLNSYFSQPWGYHAVP